MYKEVNMTTIASYSQALSMHSTKIVFIIAAIVLSASSLVIKNETTRMWVIGALAVVGLAVLYDAHTGRSDANRVVNRRYQPTAAELASRNSLMNSGPFKSRIDYERDSGIVQYPPTKPLSPMERGVKDTGYETALPLSQNPVLLMKNSPAAVYHKRQHRRVTWERDPEEDRLNYFVQY